jgi:AcrR family transcriptional regulator
MIEVDEADIKKKRTLKIFINAAAQIIEDEGIEAVTIRKVADLAGYNSATIYNYFDNSNQLISFAALKFVKDYTQELPKYIADADDCLDRFLLVWECFCKHCFNKPNIYYAIFTEHIGDKPDDLIRNYYSLFPEELGDPPEELLPMLMESNFYERCQILIEPCIEKGYFTEQQAQNLNEMIRLLYQGMLSLIINNRVNYSPDEAVEHTMKHIREIANERVNR